MATTLPPLPPAIYVDVDDTLVRTIGTRRIPMPAMVALVRTLLDDASAAQWSAVELHPAQCSGMTADEVLAQLKA